MMLKRRRSGKKSQAAMEYLHTYGWVFLTAIVIGSVLIYHNVSNAKYVVPLECKFLSGLNCVDAGTEETLLSLAVINEFNFAISNISVSVSGTCNSTANTSDGNIYSNPNVMLENHQYTFIFECQNLTNMRLSETISLGYVNVETGEQHVKVGKLEFSPTG
jgi:hypothetical protein